MLLVVRETRLQVILLNLESGRIDYAWTWDLDERREDTVWTRIA